MNNKKYDIIYADPPWQYNQCGKTGRGIAQNNYPVMTLKELKSLDIQSISNDTTMLFMWVTCPQLYTGLELIRQWGFIYKTVAFVWIKKNKVSNTNFIGMGSYTRSNSEFCLLGVSKNTKPSEHIVRRNISQIIESKIEIHSKKPDIVREKIIELTGENKNRIELFARQETNGWDVWGNEVNSNIIIGKK